MVRWIPQLSLSSFLLPDSDHVDKKACECKYYPNEPQWHNQVECRSFGQQQRCKTHCWKPKKQDRTDCKDNMNLVLGRSKTPSWAVSFPPTTPPAKCVVPLILWLFAPATLGFPSFHIAWCSWAKITSLISINLRRSTLDFIQFCLWISPKIIKSIQFISKHKWKIMERKRVGTAFMVVVCLGIIITTVGRFAALGIDQGGTAYRAFDTAFLCFVMFFFIVIAVFGQDFSKDEQNQPEAELDSSLY